MYETRFGLKEKPFSPLPDADFLYRSEPHVRALEALEEGLASHVHVTVLTGDTGCGKTTLIRHLLSRLDDDIDSGLITHSSCVYENMLECVLLSFDLEYRGQRDAQRYQALSDYLIRQRRQRRKTVLIVDEAHNLDVQALTRLYLICNVTRSNEYGIRLVLVGQSGLRHTLARLAKDPCAGHMTIVPHIRPFNQRETADYIRHRVHIAGGERNIFQSHCYEMIHQASNGVPRLINLVCDTALVYGYLAGKTTIDPGIVGQVIRDKQHSISFETGTLNREAGQAAVSESDCTSSRPKCSSITATRKAIKPHIKPKVSYRPIREPVAPVVRKRLSRRRGGKPATVTTPILSTWRPRFRQPNPVIGFGVASVVALSTLGLIAALVFQRLETDRSATERAPLYTGPRDVINQVATIDRAPERRKVAPENADALLSAQKIDELPAVRGVEQSALPASSNTVVPDLRIVDAVQRSSKAGYVPLFPTIVLPTAESVSVELLSPLMLPQSLVMDHGAVTRLATGQDAPEQVADKQPVRMPAAASDESYRDSILLAALEDRQHSHRMTAIDVRPVSVIRGLEIPGQGDGRLPVGQPGSNYGVDRNRSAPDSADAKIVALLSQAESALAQRRLTRPRGQSAADAYRQVLALSPDNRAAKQGLKTILQTFKGWARKAEREGDWARVERYSRRMLEIDATHRIALAHLARLGIKDWRTASRRVDNPGVVAARQAMQRNVSTSGDLEQALIESVSRGDLLAVRRLLETGASPDARGAHGYTGLILASIDGRADIVRELLRRQADVNARTEDRKTALMAAAWNGYGAIVKLLLREEVDVNARSSDGWTALNYAIWKGYQPIVSDLLEHGADATIQDTRGWTAAAIAEHRGHPAIASLLNKASR